MNLPKQKIGLQMEANRVIYLKTGSLEVDDQVNKTQTPSFLVVSDFNALLERLEKLTSTHIYANHKSCSENILAYYDIIDNKREVSNSTKPTRVIVFLCFDEEDTKKINEAIQKGLSRRRMIWEKQDLEKKLLDITKQLA